MATTNLEMMRTITGAYTVLYYVYTLQARRQEFYTIVEYYGSNEIGVNNNHR